MKGRIIGYDADMGEIIIRILTSEDNDSIPLNKEVEIKVIEE